jgi:hypothetical protein
MKGIDMFYLAYGIAIAFLAFIGAYDGGTKVKARTKKECDCLDVYELTGHHSRDCQTQV